MFSSIKALPADPILGLSRLFAEDPRPHKIDLGVGIYKNEENITPIMRAVQAAQDQVIREQASKAYTPPEGAPGFTDALLHLVFGSDHPSLKDGRLAAIQTPGGCGALRVGAELLKRQQTAALYAGTPTWANHQPLISAAGIRIEMIPYYDAAHSRVDFNAYMDRVSKLTSQDVLLLHGSCHNPTGADLSLEEADAVIEAAQKQGFLLFIDTAYHGFAKDPEADAAIIRKAAQSLPELLVAYSCSKNFGLYRERTGGLMVLGETADKAAAAKSHMLNIAREIYSMPPAHGGHIVTAILGSDDLTHQWREELADMTKRMKTNRTLLVETARSMGLGQQLDFLEQQNGMFSLLPLSPDQVLAMREAHGIYMTGNGRINLCGLNRDNVEVLCKAYRDVKGSNQASPTQAA